MALGSKRRNPNLRKFPQIEGSVVTSFNTGTNITVTLPSGIKPGELIVIFVGLAGAATITDISTPSGYTELADALGTTVRVGIYYKVAVGTEGASQAVTWLTGSMRSRAVAFRVSGYQGTPEVTAFTNVLASATIDPPALTPSWGTDENLWVAAFLGDTNGNTSVNPVAVFPDDYKNNRLSICDTNADSCGAGMATRTISETSQDPTAFIGQFTATLAEVITFTMAIRGI